MTEDKMSAIVSRLVEELRELPNLTEITTYQLAHQAGFDTDAIDNMDFLSIDYLLRKAASKAHITIDGSKHDGLVEGLTFNLDYIVKNDKAYVKCPRCGSKDTARILYGMPAMDDVLEKKLESGKVILGGCCVTGAEVNGKHIWIDPKRHCNGCRRDFASPPVFFVNDAAFDYRDEVTTIHFRDGGFFQGHTDLVIKKEKDGIIARHSGFDPLKDEAFEHRYTMPEREWNRLLDAIFCTYYLHEWKKQYRSDILDGEQWSVTISLSIGHKRNYSGSNAFPAYWKEFQKSMERIIDKCKP